MACRDLFIRYIDEDMLSRQQSAPLASSPAAISTLDAPRAARRLPLEGMRRR